ncbi:hypothetical protein [Paenibacillus sp. NRS-1760]|uniref:hypothetical protein n=1 Tax=Paenibacillus sp. NRS-1760 TaxID=3233902 RepID=UPI003D29F2C2
MLKLSWKGCSELAHSILQSRPGEWSHRIEGQKVRFEKRVKVPNGQVRIFYRSKEAAGSYSEEAWQREAQPLNFQQLTLF